MNRRTFLQSAVAAGTFASWLPGSILPSQIGANTAIKGWSLLDSLELLKTLRFPIVEIHPMGQPEPVPGQFPGFVFDQLTAEQKSGIRAALTPFPHVTAHLPYTGLDYFAGDEAAVKVVDTALEGSAYFGAELAVLHPKEGAWPLMLKRIRRWGDMAQERKMRIALETGYPRSVRDFVRLVREVDHPAVGATVDVGHQSQYAELLVKVRPEDRATPAGIKAYNDTTLAIIEELGPKTFHLHVHDIEPATWKEHMPVGTNFVDYKRLFTLLDKVDYRGYFILEIGGSPQDMEHHLRDGKSRLEAILARMA